MSRPILGGAIQRRLKSEGVSTCYRREVPPTCFFHGINQFNRKRIV